MKLPEKLTYTLPTSDASSMKICAKLLSENFDTFLETEPGIEHEYGGLCVP